jgi:NAD(P)-dependent dehydrogenase (short-subunit alcohol dehydrogenase family)
MANADSMNELLDPAGRVVMLSGASRGIGLAIARHLHAEGYTLSLGTRRPGAVAAIATFDAARTLVHWFDAERVEAASDWVEDNAGVLRLVDLRSGDESSLDEMWTVNVKAPFRMVRLVLPYLEKGGHGRIINISSTDGKRYRDTVSVGYAMSKHALMALTHAAKFAGWEKGVRVTALCPGAVDTDLVAAIPGVTPSANRITPETIAETVAFLLRLPNVASVAELVMNTRLESWI